jgi:hypothetical protein
MFPLLFRFSFHILWEKLVGWLPPERKDRMEQIESNVPKVEVELVDKKKAKKERKEKKKRKRDLETSHPEEKEEETATSTPTAEIKDEEERKKKKDPNLKKKKRRSTESSDNGQQNSSTKKADDDVPSKRLKRSRPLAGKVIAVTTLAESSAASCPENFTHVMNLLKEAGAKPCNQVHKKTFCLVASESAVAGETQRVRKAWKKGIPVVDVAWVRLCVEDACVRPFGEFLVGPDSSKRKTKVGKGVAKPAPNASVKDDADPLREAGWSKSVDLGCCCSCHETGVTDCEWCVECSVNTAAKI